ncbi:NAD(P)-dependent alcohol dehydrogenase [Candidatus Bipolaricaulota bacterium]|nr:NAD(P)-dependent alcohol dehydrogenase [Candidatus Bipolaricaulota bacterium]
MKAIVFEEYGPPEVLSLREIERPVVRADEILVKVRAAAVNPQDWHCVRGTPFLARLMVGGLFKPGHQVLGSDVAGIVEAVGKSVRRFQPGDEGLGLSLRHGGFAEVVCLPESGVVVTKPANLSFEEAAAVPMASVMALMGLRDKGRIKPGDKVLINGASGGIGTFAVQIAKAMGAVVTGVCSTRNLELVRSLGADRVIDYTQDDFAREDTRYDVIFDVVAKRSFAECRHALTRNGIYVTTAMSLGLLLRSLWIALTSGKRLKPMLQRPTQADLAVVGEYIEAGKLRSVIDRCYPLAEVPEAISYVEKGHARGKVVITIAPQEGDSE